MSDEGFGKIIAGYIVGMLMGWILGLTAGTKMAHQEALEANAAYYETKTGAFVYGIVDEDSTK